MKVAIIGGGAAGFFSAISCKAHNPNAHVTIYEKTTKCLSKVKVSGGGRCNVTHNCKYPSDLSKNYPRGGRFLRKLFKQFNNNHMWQWLESKKVKLKIEEDGRTFPVSNDSQTIIDCLLQECKINKVNVLKKSAITEIEVLAQGFRLKSTTEREIFVDKVIVASGGSNKKEHYNWLIGLGVNIVSPIPSLFTFNMPNENIRSLMGVTVPNTTVSIVGTKYKSNGPVLITHWGLSGPAILVLSSWAAQKLHEDNYHFKIAINWTAVNVEEELREFFQSNEGNKLMKNYNPIGLPHRLWIHLLNKAEVHIELPWKQQSKKRKNKLINLLFNDIYEVKGKTTFKEEFVTCGGVSLDSINPNSLESLSTKGLYFAGEILDIDALTGGFNFQAAWTTGYISGQLK